MRILTALLIATNSEFVFAETANEAAEKGWWDLIYEKPLFLVPIAAALFAALIGPSVRDISKYFLSRRALLRMIEEDVKERSDHLQAQIPEITDIIKLTSDSHTYYPLILNLSGLEGYIDWQKEKWLLPSGLSRDITRFYSRTQEMSDLTDKLFTEESQIRKLPRERFVGGIIRLRDTAILAHQEAIALEEKLIKYREMPLWQIAVIKLQKGRKRLRKL